MPEINPGHKFCIRYAKYLYFDKKGVKNRKLAVFKKNTCNQGRKISRSVLKVDWIDW